MRSPLVAGNWKMNKTTGEAIDLIEKLKEGCEGLRDVEIVVCPPFTALQAVSQALLDSLSPIRVGAQDLHWEIRGAYTGEVSPEMLRDLGCQFVIVGHSERRQFFHETDLAVSKKMAAARSQGLIPIVCVGESLEEREGGKTFSVVERQLRGGFSGWNPDLGEVVIAYEPIWAIGTGRNATPEQANEVHAFIRHLLIDLFGEEVGSLTRILYGGSVNPNNIQSLMAQPELDGTLVGGASLQAESFGQIIKASIKSTHGL